MEEPSASAQRTTAQPEGKIGHQSHAKKHPYQQRVNRALHSNRCLSETCCVAKSRSAVNKRSDARKHPRAATRELALPLEAFSARLRIRTASPQRMRVESGSAFFEPTSKRIRTRRYSVAEAEATVNAMAAWPTVICLLQNAMANNTRAFTVN